MEPYPQVEHSTLQLHSKAALANINLATSTGKSCQSLEIDRTYLILSSSEEQQPLEEFFKTKGLKTRNEMLDDSNAILAAALKDEDMASSEEEVVAARADRGSADEDEESVDEDFQADSESDVAEEYDSAHESSGAEDEDMADADGGADGAESDPPEEERPKKKTKVAK